MFKFIKYRVSMFPVKRKGLLVIIGCDQVYSPNPQCFQMMFIGKQ